MEGAAIRRKGYQCWQRNLAVALGNADYDAEILIRLKERLPSASAMVAEHIEWAIAQQQAKAPDDS